MYGAVIGDVAGSMYENRPIKYKNFKLLDDVCYMTDDSICTVAVAKALLESKEDYSDLEERVKDFIPVEFVEILDKEKNKLLEVVAFEKVLEDFDCFPVSDNEDGDDEYWDELYKQTHQNK